MLTEPTLIDPLAVRKLVAAVEPRHREAARESLALMAYQVVDEGAQVLETALLKARPDLASLVRRLQPHDHDEQVTGPAGEVLVMERDAAKLALSIAGLGDNGLQAWNRRNEDGFLASLAYEPPEDALLAHDATRFPQWAARAGGRPDWITFTNGVHHMRIGNVNRTRLEHVLGVDLIYRHVELNTVVLVQYKRMTRDNAGKWSYLVDKQLEKELERMRRVDAQGATDDSVRTWRLHPRGCVLKLVRQPRRFDPSSDSLLPGIYPPLAYLDELLADTCTRTSRGGHRLGYHTIDRYITTNLFVELVRQGWIGTRGPTTAAVGGLIDAAVEAQRSVIVAEEWGEQTGAERRQRPRL